MTEAELLQALLVRPSAAGHTTEEWAERLKVSPARTRKLLRAGIKQKKVAVGKGLRPAMDGRHATVPVYRVIR